MTPSPPAPASTACRPLINRSSSFTPSSSSPLMKLWHAPRTPTNSSCASRAFVPLPTPPARKWSARWPTSSASPANRSSQGSPRISKRGPMKKQTLRLSLFALVLLAVFFFAIPSDSAPRPLSRSELLALVAGDCLPENTVAEIQSRGLAFPPDDNYKSLLKTAGADAKVLAALSAAKIAPPAKADSAESSGLLQHLSAAGKMLHAGQFAEASAELSAAVTNDFGKPEAGFVMGMILLDQQHYDQAGALYSEIFREDPDFPQLHTRLSAAYYNVGDTENAFREAKAAIAENPDNPAAHLNAGLALSEMRKFDAAKSELQASIRSKPDYARAYSALGGILDDLHDFEGAVEQYKKVIALG